MLPRNNELIDPPYGRGMCQAGDGSGQGRQKVVLQSWLEMRKNGQN